MGFGKILKVFIKKIVFNKKVNVNIYNIDGIDFFNEFV